jgi:hypothetical protein
MYDRFVKTEFKIVKINYTPENGIPIGLGKCKAVQLQLNAFPRNVSSAYINTPFFVYYGDAQSQEVELYAVDNGLNGGYSPFIYCRDLSEVFVRFAMSEGAPDSAIVNILVYS